VKVLQGNGIRDIDDAEKAAFPVELAVEKVPATAIDNRPGLGDDSGKESPQ
jgi:hypothetical protein